jgi:hypothetical protein
LAALDGVIIQLGTGDMLYMPDNEPKNHQIMFDALKNYDIVPEDSDISQYDFLISPIKNKNSDKSLQT